jgi:hypothetical protein
MDRPKTFALSGFWEVVLVNVVLLLPAVSFWLSVMMYLAFGTDYFFDVVFAEMSKTFWGNTVLIMMVIGLPGLAVGLNGLVYLKKKDRMAWWGIAVGIVFLALGFTAIVKRI